MPLNTRPCEAAAYLDSDAAIAAYLTEALETNDPGLIADALGAVARGRGMSEVTRAAGASRASLYRALSAEGNPECGFTGAEPFQAAPRRGAAAVTKSRGGEAAQTSGAAAEGGDGVGLG
jgi:probable addiction module antidote protein